MLLGIECVGGKLGQHRDGSSDLLHFSRTGGRTEANPKVNSVPGQEQHPHGGW